MSTFMNVAFRNNLNGQSSISSLFMCSLGCIKYKQSQISEHFVLYSRTRHVIHCWFNKSRLTFYAVLGLLRSLLNISDKYSLSFSTSLAIQTNTGSLAIRQGSRGCRNECQSSGGKRRHGQVGQLRGGKSTAALPKGAKRDGGTVYVIPERVSTYVTVSW